MGRLHAEGSLGVPLAEPETQEERVFVGVEGTAQLHQGPPTEVGAVPTPTTMSLTPSSVPPVRDHPEAQTRLLETLRDLCGSPFGEYFLPPSLVGPVVRAPWESEREVATANSALPGVSGTSG